MGKGEFRRSEKKAVAALDHELKWSGKEAAARVLAARFGEQMEDVDIDERTSFWLNAYSLAERERPYTTGIPLPIRPLSIVDLVEKLSLPTSASEAVAVVCAMDSAWLKWKDSKQRSKTPP